MLRKLWTKLDDAERRFRRSWGKDMETPSGRFWGKVHYHLFDHAFLRVFWTNFYPVGKDAWRSNQPTRARFRKYADMGIKTVINLRGPDVFAHYILEREAVEEFGMTLVDKKLWARSAAPRANIVAVIDALREAEKPLVFHCKSGADRAGFVAAMYQMIFEGASVAEARKQLSLKFIHLKFTATGLQDFILDVYEARLALGDISFEDWIRTEYRAKVIGKAYRTRSAAETARALMPNSAEPDMAQSVSAPA